MMPQNGQLEVVKNRLTHSYEVATSSEMMAASISLKLGLNVSSIDYKLSVKNASLMHDIGHPSFGHDGAELIDIHFKALGVTEGFSDNNNNLTVIEKNNIVVSDYSIASIIKYPESLYPEQKVKYLPILKTALKQDEKHYKSIGINLTEQTKTIACQIMDEADRNSYACSDLSDFLCLGNTVDIQKLHRMAKNCQLNYRYGELATLSEIIRDNSKGSIKSYFNDIKNRFNQNYTLTNNGLTVINKDLENYREFLYDLSFEFYIKPIRNNKLHSDNILKLKNYIQDVVDGKCSPSDHYTRKIKESKNDIEKYTYMRDMIAEVSDWYILNYNG
jgi:dGTP triphosphohydrolase